MKAAPLLIVWHDDSAPVYSVDFDPKKTGRFATGGNDNNIRIWRVDAIGGERKVTYLSTLTKHTQAVNVVRFSPTGEMLASAGDDGNVLLWVQSELTPRTTFGNDQSDDVEHWRVRSMCRSSGAEIYDLAWSPDGAYFITGSMDNVARIYDARTGQLVRHVAEHSHYIQGVAWDPLNDFIATQSSDRSVHIYSLRTNNGEFSLTSHAKFFRMDFPPRRKTNNHARTLTDHGTSHITARPSSSHSNPPRPSSASSTPDTPVTKPMDPPPVSHSRQSSVGSSASLRASMSPVPAMPLPAVKPLEPPSPRHLPGNGAKSANLYANETLTSFFRRLTFSPDGALLFTPAGLYKTSASTGTPAYGKMSNGPAGGNAKVPEATANTVFIYTRAGLNKPPVAHLPRHRKPSIAVSCSPVAYKLRDRNHAAPTRHMLVNRHQNGGLTVTENDSSTQTTDTSVVPNSNATAIENGQHDANTSNNDSNSNGNNSSTNNDNESNKNNNNDGSHNKGSDESSSNSNGNSNNNNNNKSKASTVFALDYRTVYAVATQDSVLVYDTQQRSPLCVVSNLHFATFTDLSWSTDGCTLIMTSSDGFCSVLAFDQSELGEVHTGPLASQMMAPGERERNGSGTAMSMAGISKIPEPTVSVGERPAARVSNEEGQAGTKRPNADAPTATNREATDEANNGEGGNGTVKKRRIAPTFVSGL